MKKTFVALAALMAAGAASAQSSVAMFGIVDLAVQYGTADNNALRVASNGNAASRLGIRGTEDLGGGLRADIWLEGQLEADTGAGQPTNVNNQANPAPLAAGTQGLTFNRRSTVGISGNFGEVRLGRDYMGHFFAYAVYDPFGSNGVGASLAFVNHITSWSTAGRGSNSVHYLLPRVGGLYGQIGYHLGDNLRDVANSDAGNGWSSRLGYASGPFDVSAAYGRVDLVAVAPAGTFSEVTTWNLGGSWNFGAAKLMGMVGRSEFGAPAATREISSWVAGVNVPVGVGEIRAAYSESEQSLATGAEPRQRKVALGYVHNLSKRTALYTTVAHLRNSGGSSVALGGAAFAAGNRNGISTGLDLGVRHSF